METPKECKYCESEIVDEFESHVIRSKLTDTRDPGSETIYEYAHLNCYLRNMLNFIGIEIEGMVEWWVDNP